MIERNHTPAPWVVDGLFTEGGHQTRVAFPDRHGVPSETIAECFYKWHEASHISERISWKNAEANARLIAAAPDLLESLELFLDAVETDVIRVCPSEIDQLIAITETARAAIDKATGGEA